MQKPVKNQNLTNNQSDVKVIELANIDTSAFDKTISDVNRTND